MESTSTYIGSRYAQEHPQTEAVLEKNGYKYIGYAHGLDTFSNNISLLTLDRCSILKRDLKYDVVSYKKYGFFLTGDDTRMAVCLESYFENWKNRQEIYE